MDDVGLITDEGGWVTIQAKKGMRVEKRPGGGLGEAIRQLVEIDEVGVPDGTSENLRTLEPGRDLVLILSDDSAAQTVNRNLAPVTGRLRDLPVDVPLADAVPSGEQAGALETLKAQIEHCWNERWGRDTTEAEFRRLTRVLSIRALSIAEGGEDYATVRVKLRDLAGDTSDAEALWSALLTEAQRLAEERAYLDRNGLVKALDARGFILRPAARLRSDIDALRARSKLSAGLLGEGASIATPEGPVRLARAVGSALLGAGGDVAVTGVPGSGKTALLHALAEATKDTHDLAVLRSEDLQSSRAATRAELGLGHDLAEVLAGWTGQRPGLLLIDGIDQARGADAPDWLPALATTLKETRWQVVATIRSFDLKHSPKWKGMFRGSPVEGAPADPELAGVRHLLVGDLAAEELADVRASSPALAGLLGQAEPRVRELLANPFNLNLAGQLLSDGEASILQVHTRAELLAQYWRARVGLGPSAGTRTRTLRALVHLMLAGGRQVAREIDLPAGTDGQALADLHRSGVLRQAAPRPGTIDAPTRFAHPVLFDYAIAMLALGDPEQSDSLADALDADPNLAVTVRPSLEYRLGVAWTADPSREHFWRLALRLASKDGHPLAAGEAARVAAVQVSEVSDLAPLAAAATGAATDWASRWSHAEARLLAYLLAAAAERNGRPEALSCIDALARDLAHQAREADDVDLAAASAQLPVRAEGTLANASGVPRYPWSAITAADCMTVALKHLDDPARKLLADPAARLLALAAVTDPPVVAQVISTVIRADALHAWGMKAIRHLIRVLPAIAEKDSGLATVVATAPWQYEETRSTPTPIVGSAILELSSNLKQDVESERYAVGTHFAALMSAAPLAATGLLLEILGLPRMQFLSAADWRERPTVRQGSPLMFAGGHHVLTTMVTALAKGMEDLAEAGSKAEPDADQSRTALAQVVDSLVSGLQHGEAWKCILAHAATAQSAAFARALLPALSTPTLYAHYETWNEAAHAACRAVTMLAPEERKQIRDAIQRIPGARATPVPQPTAEALAERMTMILTAFLREATTASGNSPVARDTELGGTPDGLPPLQAEPYMPIRGEWTKETTTPGSFGDLAHRIREQLQQPAHTEKGGDATSCDALTALWDELEQSTFTGDDNEAEGHDLAAEIAERLACCPDTKPDEALGTRIVTVFRGAIPDSVGLAASAASRGADQLWGSGSAPAWAAAAATRSAQALVRLYLHESWRATHGPEIREVLAALLDSPDPLYRFIACDVLQVLPEGQDAQIAELERRVTQETDQHVATHLIHILARYARRDPTRIDGILRQLASKPDWIVLSASPGGEQPVGPTDKGSIGVSTIAALGAVYGTPFAREVLDAWLTAPADHPQRAMTALHSLSYLINPDDPAAWPAQERLLEIIVSGLAQVRTVLEDAITPGGTPEQQAKASAAVQFADHLAVLLYAESGAMDDKRQNPEEKRRGDLRRFGPLAMPLLEGLAEIHVPRVTQYVVQIVGQVAQAAPKRALLIAVKAVTSDEAYWREPTGAQTALGFVRRFAADNRSIFLGDREVVEAARRLLESFIRLGWHQAIELAEELDELFA